MVSVPIPSVFGERVRVEVMNGGGRPGMARAATGALRDAGFDVVDVGNWDSFDEPGSFVLDRVGRLETARQAADALGITDVRSEPDANLYVGDLRQYLKRPSPAGDPDARLVDPENDEGRP
jgi:hypothetical protein